MNKEQIATYFEDLQDQICHALEKADGKAKFHEDNWAVPSAFSKACQIWSCKSSK